MAKEEEGEGHVVHQHGLDETIEEHLVLGLKQRLGLHVVVLGVSAPFVVFVQEGFPDHGLICVENEDLTGCVFDAVVDVA